MNSILRSSGFVITALPAVLLSVGCAQSFWVGKEYMPGAQVKTVLASEKDKDPMLGRITPTGETVPGYSTAQAANKGYDLKWEDVENGRLCVTTEAKSHYKDGEHRAEQYDREFIESGYGADTMVFEAKKSLDDITETTQWPSSTPKGSVDKVDARAVKRTHSERASGLSGSAGLEPGYKVTYEVKWCGPAPVIAADTRYVVITRYTSGNIGVAPSYFIWAVDREPGSTSDAPPKKESAADAPPDALPSANALPAGSGDVAATAAAAGCTIFAKALVDSGIADTLKTGGPYTVFAPTDAAFREIDPRVWEIVKKSPDKLKSVIGYQVVAGKHTRADLLSEIAHPNREGTTVLRMLDGSERPLRTSGGELKLGASKIKRPDLAAKNGVVHVIDELSAPR